MARQWQVVSEQEAKSHPLYGVKNWLVVFSVGILLSVFRDVGGIAAEARQAGLTVTEFFSIDDPAVSFVKSVLSLEVGVTTTIYWLLLVKHRNFRPVASWLLVCSWPVSALIGWVNYFPGLGGALVQSCLAWGFSCVVWVTYLQRSRRVRVTFERSVLRSEDQINSDASVRSLNDNYGPYSNQSPAQRRDVASSDRFEQTKNPTKSQTLAAINSTDPSEECWSAAISEFDSETRRPGLWAKMFSDANGDEAIAKAGYLRHRAIELQRLENQSNTSCTRKHDSSLYEPSDGDFPIGQEKGLNPKLGCCPNCGDLVSLDARSCSECKAIFDSTSAWRPIAFADQDQISKLRESFLAGKKPTRNQVSFLAAASKDEVSLSKLVDSTVRADTLLHWCAIYGLAEDAETLLANGADAQALNGRGQKPFEVCSYLHLRGVLRAASI